MPRSTNIQLAKTYDPKFPDTCIGCGGMAPGASIELRRKDLEGGHVIVQIPACPVCATRLRRKHRVETALTWIIAGIGIVVAQWLLRSYEGPFKKWLAVGIAVIGFVPMVIWRLLFPLEFNMTVLGNTVTYAFRDPAYAQEFVMRNFAAVAEAAG